MYLSFYSSGLQLTMYLSHCTRRTPVTPPRWKEFDAELEAGWERIINAFLSGDKHAIATAIMCYAYYW